jgi:hypothetical protein
VELTTTLEAELAAIAHAAEPGRTAQMAVRHWGWDGRGGATLEVTGREFDGITRERVRQLCERLTSKLALARPAAPALERALVVAAHAAPTTATDLARRLADAHIAAQPFDPAGLLTAAAVLGLDATFSLDTVRELRVVLPDPPDPATDTRAVVTCVVETARALVRRAGAGRVRDVTGQVAALLAVWVDDDFVTAVLSEPEDFVWLDRRGGWFFLPSVAKNAVVSRVIKVLSVAGRIRIDDLHAGIRRDERMRDFVMPEYILAELCARIPGVTVEGAVARGAPPIAAENVLETTELTLVNLLREAGGAMERRELEARCRAAGMKLSSFHNRIAYSPLLQERGHGVYGLRGWDQGAEGGEDGRARDAAGDDDDTPRPGDLSHFHPRRGR